MTRSYSSPRVLAQHMARFDKPLLTNLAELLKTDEAEILTAHLVALVEVSAPLTFFNYRTLYICACRLACAASTGNRQTAGPVATGSLDPDVIEEDSRGSMGLLPQVLLRSLTHVRSRTRRLARA